MSNDTAPEEKEQENEKPKVAPRPVLRGLPQWFQEEYGKKRVLPPIEVTEQTDSVQVIEQEDEETGEVTVTRIDKSKIKYRDPRRIGPAAQQEKKPL